MARSVRSERGSLQLDQALVIVLLVFVAGICLWGLGEAIACSFARSQADAWPHSDYAGRCVPLDSLEATVAPAGTSRLAWTGGVPPFTLSRSASPLVALSVPAGMAVAYAADASATAVVDLDGNASDRIATVPSVPGITYYRVRDAKGNAVVATTDIPLPPPSVVDVGTGAFIARLVVYGPGGMTPAAGYVLHLTLDGNPVAVAATDGEGHATFTGLANAPYALTECGGAMPLLRLSWPAPMWYRVDTNPPF